MNKETILTASAETIRRTFISLGTIGVVYSSWIFSNPESNKLEDIIIFASSLGIITLCFISSLKHYDHMYNQNYGQENNPDLRRV